MKFWKKNQNQNIYKRGWYPFSSRFHQSLATISISKSIMYFIGFIQKKKINTKSLNINKIYIVNKEYKKEEEEKGNEANLLWYHDECVTCTTNWHMMCFQIWCFFLGAYFLNWTLHYTFNLIHMHQVSAHDVITYWSNQFWSLKICCQKKKKREGGRKKEKSTVKRRKKNDREGVLVVTGV